MKCIALRLEGPLQAWGAASVGDNRGTLDFPTKAGVLGILAACLGIGRAETERLAQLHAACRVHVRIDLAGTRIVDDQTIQGLDQVPWFDGERSSSTRKTIQSKRTYLADASFAALVVVSDESEALAIGDAIDMPHFAPYLGRRSCPPTTLLRAIPTGGVFDFHDPITAFGLVPFADPSSRLRTERRSVDAYLDGDVSDARRVRTLRIRDDLVGPLPRQWRERVVTHVRLDSNARSGDVDRNTVDPWMPTP